MNNSRKSAFTLVALILFALAPAISGASTAHARHDHSDHAASHTAPTPPQRRQAATQRQAAVTYVCPMHADVTSSKPGRCPECGMDLKVAEKTNAVAPSNEKAGTVAAAPRIPDVPVVDQQGRRLNFYSDLVRGKTVAVNFVFTTCTTICPPLTATFRKVQQELGERVGREVELISVSVDPATDTPERLKSFSEKFKAGPGWTFVTGGKPEIDQLLRALGASAPDKNDHTPMILVGNDPAGYWTRTYGLAPASTLVKVIDEAAAKGDGAVKAAAPSAAVTTPAVEKLPIGGPGDKSAPGAKPGGADYFPNHILLTQDNKPVRFYDDMLKGKVVLINFMFTTCTGVCPPMASNMAKVQNYLGDHVGKDVVMLSISVDPTVDTPDKLKKYAENFKARPGWYFLTGKKENVDWVLYKLGGYTEDKMQHSAVLIIGNESTGEWIKTAALRNPAQIAEAVLDLLKTAKK